MLIINNYIRIRLNCSIGLTSTKIKPLSRNVNKALFRHGLKIRRQNAFVIINGLSRAQVHSGPTKDTLLKTVDSFVASLASDVVYMWEACRTEPGCALVQQYYSFWWVWSQSVT